MGSDLNDRLESLGAELRDEQDRLLEDGSRRAAVRRRVLDAPARRPAPRWAWVAAAATLALLISAGFWSWRGPSPITFEVAGRAGITDAWLAAQGSTPLPLSFSDGSAVTLTQGARARVVELGARGARLVLERGRAALSVAHRDQTDWEVGVGPFEVRVTGTRFELAWEPESEELVVRVAEGSVRVTGPLLGEGRSVEAGQTLRTSSKARRMELSQAPDGAGPEAPATAEAPPPSASAASPLASASKAPDWRSLAHSGRYSEAFAAADARGFAALCASVSADELLLLADAARFSGKLAQATEAYTALRARFSGSSSAATAAFSLGRMAFDQQGAPAAAARWFTQYLSEQPGGAFAAEARGRLIEARQRSGDTSGARAAAGEYLARHPGGAHAPLARSLVGDEAGGP
jgi:hypothetical protein